MTPLTRKLSPIAATVSLCVALLTGNTVVCADTVATVTVPGTYNFEGASFAGQLVTLNLPYETASDTEITLNGTTGETLTINRSSLEPIIKVVEQSPPGQEGQPEAEGKTIIKGKLDLQINSSSAGPINAIELSKGNHTLGFEDDLSVSVDVNTQDRFRANSAALRTHNGTVHIKQNLDIKKLHVASGQESGFELAGIWANTQDVPPGHLSVKTTVEVEGQAKISDISASSSTDAESYGIFAGYGSHVTVKQGTTINNISASANSSVAVGVFAGYGGIIELDHSVSISNISAASRSYAVVSVSGGKIFINQSQSPRKVSIDQDLLSMGQNSAIEANFMTNDSVFNGLTFGALNHASEISANNDNEISTPFGDIILRFANGATWNIHEPNFLFGTLILNNNGTVNLGSAISIDNPQSVRLLVKELNGQNGMISMHVDEERGVTDQLFIGIGSGGHFVKIPPTGTGPTEESLNCLIYQARGNADFTLEGGKVELGAYTYELAQRNGMYPGESETESRWYLNQIADDYSQSGKTVLALASLAAQTTQHLNSLSDLRKRLGEVRHDTNAGLWVSVAGQKDCFTGFEGFGFTQKSWRVNLGADFMIDKWLLGANFKYADSSQKVKTDIRTKGDAHSEGINLYATYLAENGAYADFVLSADRNCQKLSTAMSDETSVSGKYDNIGYGASLEVGTQWIVSQMYGVFVEPQAQLAYYKSVGKDFTLSNNLKVSQGDYESLTGRVGAVVGKTFMDMNGTMRGQAALDLGWKGELIGKNKLRINETEFSDRLVKHRFYYGANYNVNLTDNLRCYGYVEREQGHGYTKEIEAGIGLKYTF